MTSPWLSGVALGIAMAVLGGCSGSAKKAAGPVMRSAPRVDVPAKTSAIYGVPVPESAVLDPAASSPTSQTYHDPSGGLAHFYSVSLPVDRPFMGLAFCIRRPFPAKPNAPGGVEDVWRKPGTNDLLVLRLSASAGLVTIVDDRNDPEPPCPSNGLGQP